MLRLLTCLALIAAVSCQRNRAAPRNLPQTTVARLDQRLSSEAKAETFVKCLIGPKNLIEQHCDNEGKAMRFFAPEIIRAKGDCRKVRGFKCTENDKKNIRFVAKRLNTQYPKQYLELQRYLIKTQ